MPPWISVRDAEASDRDWITTLLRARWGSTRVVSKGRVHEADALPAKIARCDGTLAGLATYRTADRACELVTLDALLPSQGIGSELLRAVPQQARACGSSRLWLITSNDNLDAVRFYQRWGLRLVAVHRGAVDQARCLKPSIPLIGELGIPIHDELELELNLEATP